jgi:NADH dehydrogenase [ubiquinone] 1 alpha subcomplex assembly factor 5
MMTVFDRLQIARQRERSAQAESGHFFLFDWAIDQIADRLSVIRRRFPLCVQIGGRGKIADFQDFGVETKITTDISLHLLNKKNLSVICSEDFFPFKASSIDLIVSPLSLHSVNDLPGALLQIRQSLKPDGVFIAAILGGETLYELRQCLNDAEIELTGGLSPRVAPFADKQQVGGLLQRAGFSLPVVDSDIVTVTYDSIFPLMKDLRLMGEGNAIAERSRRFSSRRLFLRAGELYAERFSEPDGQIRASFEVIFMLGWGPHESQQKPLKPGSANNRLADFLDTTEISTGEKTH